MSLRNKLLVVLSGVFILKIAIIIYFRTYAHPVPWEYESLVNSVLAGKGYVYNFLGADYRSYNTPLFGFLCTGVYFLTHHSYFAILLIQSLFTIFLALTVFGIAKIIMDENIGFAAAILVSLHPGFLYYDAFNLTPLSIDSFFIAVITLAFLKFMDRPRAVNLAYIGFIIGLGTMSRGILGAMLPFLALYLIFFVEGVAFKRKIKLIIVLGSAAFIVLVPWIIRNYIIHKEFVFISSTSGENLWRGNNKYAVGSSLTGDGKSIIGLWPEDFRKKVYSMSELEQKKFFEKEAMDFIRNNPSKFLELYTKKMYYFWWFSPQSGYLYPKIYLRIYKYLYSIMLPLSVFGIMMAMRSRSKITRNGAILLCFVFMSVFLTQSFFYMEGRHRWLIEPLLFIFFVYSISEVFKLISRKAIS